jgi:hypothetical protein
MEHDRIKRPRHYTAHPSGIECWDIAQYHDFLFGNVLKFVWRAGLKVEAGECPRDAQIRDLQKAKAYIDKKIEQLEKEGVTDTYD